MHMLTEKGEINWVETLAQLAADKGNQYLAEYIRAFKPIPAPVVTAQTSVDYTRLSSSFNITKMPEASCDGCE